MRSVARAALNVLDDAASELDRVAIIVVVGCTAAQGGAVLVVLVWLLLLLLLLLLFAPPLRAELLLAAEGGAPRAKLRGAQIRLVVGPLLLLQQAVGPDVDLAHVLRRQQARHRWRMGEGYRELFSTFSRIRPV